MERWFRWLIVTSKWAHNNIISPWDIQKQFWISNCQTHFINITTQWMSRYLADDESSLLQIMPCQYRCWSISMTRHGVTRKKNKTRMWNMISSPATPTVCLEQKSENLQSRNVPLSMPSPSQQLLYLIWFAMLLVILQLDLHFQLNNHPIRPPNAVSGDLRHWKWNRILVAAAT